MPEVMTHVIERPEDVIEFWVWLTRDRGGWIACDTETTGLDWNEEGFEVRLVQFGDTHDGWVVELDRWRGLVQAAFDWVRDHGVRLIFHNHTYDMNVLRQAGIRPDWSLVGDTFVLAGLLGFADQSRRLKDTAMREFGPWAGVGEKLLKAGMKENGWDWATVPVSWQPYPFYAAMDTCLTAMLWQKWLPMRDKWLVHHDLEMRVGRVVSDMMWNGLTVDGPYLVREIERWGEEEETLRAGLLSLGITSPSKNAEVAAALRREGVVLTAMTATGKHSVDKDVLSEIDHDIARMVVRYRLVHRVRGTYLQKLLVPCLDKCSGEVLDRGLIHPSISPMEAKTGRMSISHPPMQQLPRDDKTVRNAVIPRNKGEVLVSADYGQIEMRMWARLTRDQALIDVFRQSDADGSDFFVAVGRDVYQEPEFSKGDPRRTLIKNVSYGTIYGAGLETLAASAKVPLAQMAPVDAALKARYSSFQGKGMDLVQMGRDGGGMLWYVIAPDGRRIAVRQRDEARKLPNYLDQGASAVILKKAMVMVAEAGLGDYLVLPVHDELLVSVPEGEAEEAGLVLQKCMESAAAEGGDGGVRIPAVPSAGAQRWGEVGKK